MATVTGYTAERMQEIEDSTVVDGSVDGSGHLILQRRDSAIIDAGSVIGPVGPTGPTGATSIAICTSATRPVGGARFEGLMIYETDTDRLYTWDGAAWIYRGDTVLCTSGTRPSTPFDGMQIYETDTKRPYIYNGTAWVYRGGVWICTSGTRPASPFAGLEIFETDTKRLLVYNGTAWAGVRSVMYSGVSAGQVGFSTPAVNLITINVPDHGCAGILTVSTHIRLDRTAPTDAFEVSIYDNVTEITKDVIVGGVTTTMCHPIGEIAQAAGAPKTIKLNAVRAGGAGTGTVFGDPKVSYMNILFTPSA